MADDAWLTAPPRTQNIIDWANIILGGEADYIRLCEGLDSGKTFSGDPRLFIVSARYKYRASLVPALWWTSKFLGLLKEDNRESCWTFEIRGSERAWGDDERFLGAKDSLTLRWPHKTDPDWWGSQEPIVRGQWTETAKEYAKREGITIDWEGNPHGWR